MATIPGAAVIPLSYQSTMVLYTAMDKVEAVVDGAPPGKLGRLFIVEPDKAVKVPWEAGRFIIEHLGYTGVVRVEETESETGVTYNIEKARTESLLKGEEEDKKRIQIYIEYCVKDKMENKRPVPTPPESIMRILDRRKVDLRKFGIVPLGWATPEDEDREKLKAENASLSDQLRILQSQVAQLLEGKGGGGKK